MLIFPNRLFCLLHETKFHWLTHSNKFPVSQFFSDVTTKLSSCLIDIQIQSFYVIKIINTKLSTQNYQHKIINTKLSTQNYQHRKYVFFVLVF